MPATPPPATERLLVDRGDLVVPVEAVRLGQATVGSVLRSLRSIGLDDVAPDVDEAAWRLQQALRRPVTAVTPLLDGLLWRAPRTGGSASAGAVAALLRGLLLASAWALGIGPLLLLPGDARMLPIADAAIATVVLLAMGVASLVVAATQLLAVVEAASLGSRHPTATLAIALVGVLWGAVPIWAVHAAAPTWLSLHPWTTWPAIGALLVVVVAMALQDALPGGARRRRAVPPQSMPRATAVERLEALVAVGTARLAHLDAEQERRLDAAVATAVRELRARGDVDDRTHDLLLAGEADEGFDPLPTVLLAFDPAAPVPLGADVPWRSIVAVLAPGEAAVQLTTALGGLVTLATPAPTPAPGAWQTARSERARIAQRQQVLERELDLHADPIALAGIPVLDDAASEGVRGWLARTWRALPWLVGAGAIWTMLMAFVVARAGDALGTTSAWVAWAMLLLGLVGAVGWMLALEIVEALQRQRSRAGAVLWQLVGVGAALALVATLVHDGGVGEGVVAVRAIVVASLLAAVVAATLRRVAWWRGAVPSRRVRGLAEWPLRRVTAASADAARRQAAAARRALDPETFDRTRARLAAVALVPIARGAMQRRALDDPDA